MHVEGQRGDPRDPGGGQHERVLKEKSRIRVSILDEVPSNMICALGGDYCFLDEVHGHQVLARQNVSAALDREVEDGVFDARTAKAIDTRLFVETPQRLSGP